MTKERMERAAGLVTMGTVGTVKPFNLRGVLPSHNFLDGYLEGAEALDGTSWMPWVSALAGIPAMPAPSVASRW